MYISMSFRKMYVTFEQRHMPKVSQVWLKVHQNFNIFGQLYYTLSLECAI